MSEGSILNRIYDKALTIIGDIKVFPHPMWIVYDPSEYKVTGEDVQEIIEILQEGDILLRFYKNYLDGKFIKGVFSHAAYYVGNNNVVHAIAENVQIENIHEFIRCDGICILRFKSITKADIKKASVKARKLVGKKYDFEFESDDDKYYCSELVREIYKHKNNTMNIFETEVSMLGGLLKRRVILPDAFVVSPAFNIIYMNPCAGSRYSKQHNKDKT